MTEEKKFCAKHNICEVAQLFAGTGREQSAGGSAMYSEKPFSGAYGYISQGRQDVYILQFLLGPNKKILTKKY